MAFFWKYWRTAVSWAGIDSGKHPVYYLSFIIFLWYGNHAAVFFEYKLPLNEMFSLFGFFLFVTNPVIYKKNDYLYNCVMMILFIFSVYALFSLLFFKSLYGYLRNLVLLYSVFSFFLGIRFYDVLSSVGKRDLLFLSALVPSGEFYRTYYAASLPLYFSRYFNRFRRHILGFIVVIVLAVKMYFGGTTGIAIILTLVFLTVITEKGFRIAAGLCIILTAAFFIYMNPYLSLLLEDAHRINYIQSVNPLFRLDPNATTRFFMWSYLFFKVFLKNLFGIGLGTVLLPHDFLWEDLRMWFRDDPYHEYTVGAHNSFITVAVRFGVIGIAPFLMLYWRLVIDFIRERAADARSRMIFFYFPFFMISITASLNVVLASPLSASLYWGLLGLLYQARRVIGRTQG